MDTGRTYYPQGMAGEFALKQDIKRERKKRIDKMMCYESHGPGWTYNETIGKCLMPAGFIQDGTNIPDLVNDGMPPNAVPEPENLPTSPPEGGGNAAITAEVNNRKDEAVLGQSQAKAAVMRKRNSMQAAVAQEQVNQLKQQQIKMTRPLTTL